MKSLLVLFNGIKFPYYLMEYAIAQAKEHSASLHALFLKAKDETNEGYGFPSDLAQAETLTDSEDAERSDIRIIKHHIKLAADMAATENVSCTTELMTDSSLSEILHIVNSYDLICLDQAYDDETPSMLTNNRFTSKDLIEQSSASVKLISEDMMDDQ